MLSDIKIKEALLLEESIIDVRSEGEFKKGHIPGAVNIPLFSNDERAHVGTVYKQESKEAAIDLGYQYVTPKLKSFLDDSSKVAGNGKLIVHCWRGGMRSQAFAKHLTHNGFKDVKVITGGYKAFRNHVLESLAIPYNLKVLGGFTGSGKTHILHELKKRGQQVIDLEGLANHKGSAFGGIGQLEQPSVEQFENDLFQELKKLEINKAIWVEDESHNIGKVQIPMPFYNQIRNSMLYFIDIPKDERAKHLVTEYADCNSDLLAESIHHISKRLGGLNVKNAIEFLENKNYYEVAKIALHYYDKSYKIGLSRRIPEMVIKINLPSTAHIENALEIENLVVQHGKSKTHAI